MVDINSKEVQELGYLEFDYSKSNAKDKVFSIAPTVDESTLKVLLLDKMTESGRENLVQNPL
jgi:hypothetical protein